MHCFCCWSFISMKVNTKNKLLYNLICRKRGNYAILKMFISPFSPVLCTCKHRYSFELIFKHSFQTAQLKDMLQRTNILDLSINMANLFIVDEFKNNIGTHFRFLLKLYFRNPRTCERFNIPNTLFTVFT